MVQKILSIILTSLPSWSLFFVQEVTKHLFRLVDSIIRISGTYFFEDALAIGFLSGFIDFAVHTLASLQTLDHVLNVRFERSQPPATTKEKMMGAYAMERVAKGAHLAIPWRLSLRNARAIKRTTAWARADYCLRYSQLLPWLRTRTRPVCGRFLKGFSNDAKPLLSCALKKVWWMMIW